MQPKNALLGACRRAGEHHLSRVDVPFGDRPLRVTGLQLDIRLRVSGSRIVRDRRMPEVVKWSEWLRDSGALQGWLQVHPGQLARVGWRPFRRVAEDQIA